MIENLLWIILVAAALTTILAIAVLVRLSQGFQHEGKEMRDELRASWEEARGAGKELREEVSVGLKLTNDTLSKTLEGMGTVQRTQLEGMTKQLKELTESNQTDFGIMFLATEGLYAEVLRQPALVDDLQQRYRVVLAGPTTLVAILSSLRMGFQTLAIEQRASEVWRVLGAIKTEFGKFSDVLDKVKRQLKTASHTIEQTGVRSRAMERRLRSVEQLPEAEASKFLSAGILYAEQYTAWHLVNTPG